MKKLKIFLLLSIILCFGFVSNSEVHAQGDGPRNLEVGDVLDGVTLYFAAGSQSYSTGTIIETSDGYTIVASVGGGPTEPRLLKVFLNGVFVTTLFDDDNGGWLVNSYSSITGTVTAISSNSWYDGITAVFVSGYAITFEENGGTTQTDLTGQTALPNQLPIPTKSGYAFAGWYYDSAFTQKANAGDAIESNVILYAKWQLNAYTITYNSNGGSSIPQISDAAQLPNPLPIPTKSGYTFGGWYYDSDFTNEAFANDPLTGDVTLYAKWDLTSGPKAFQVGDVLPTTTQLRISWSNYQRMPLNELTYIDLNNINGSFIIVQDNDPYLTQFRIKAPDGSSLFYTTTYDYENTSIIINTSAWSESERTVTYVSSALSMFTWEDLTPNVYYQDGYSDGYQKAMEYYGWNDGGEWYTGEQVREIFGYYDPITGQWLSVEEYLDLYGTDKLGQSDFYNNFDKYFIPAMIIVFGGAIVLTLLKVFKGRE